MEKITITKIGRKQQPSKFKQGETYTITTIMDDKGRKLVAMGGWSDSWKVGDVVEGEVSEKKWTDKDGFEQTSLNLTNPNKKSWSGGQGGGAVINTTIISYQIAAQLAPLLYADAKKKVKLDDIVALADEIKKKISVDAPAAVAKEDVPKVNVEEEVKDEKPKKKEVDADFDDEEDDEKPF